MADLTGISKALKAYKNTLNSGEEPIIEGYLPTQRFFIAYAQSWMYKSRQNYLRRQVMSDTHSPAEYRVNGIVKNIDEFYDAFNVEYKDTLYLCKSERVKIW